MVNYTWKPVSFIIDLLILNINYTCPLTFSQGDKLSDIQVIEVANDTFFSIPDKDGVRYHSKEILKIRHRIPRQIDGNVPSIVLIDSTELIRNTLNSIGMTELVLVLAFRASLNVFFGGISSIQIQAFQNLINIQ